MTFLGDATAAGHIGKVFRRAGQAVFAGRSGRGTATDHDSGRGAEDGIARTADAGDRWNAEVAVKEKIFFYFDSRKPAFGQILRFSEMFFLWGNCHFCRFSAEFCRNQKTESLASEKLRMSGLVSPQLTAKLHC